jgi:hypothetical protein
LFFIVPDPKTVTKSIKQNPQDPKNSAIFDTSSLKTIKHLFHQLTTPTPLKNNPKHSKIQLNMLHLAGDPPPVQTNRPESLEIGDQPSRLCHFALFGARLRFGEGKNEARVTNFFLVVLTEKDVQEEAILDFQDR